MFLLGIIASSCVTTPLEHKVAAIYIGNSADQTLYGNKNESIKCSDAKFDSLVCMPQQDFETLVANGIK